MGLYERIMGLEDFKIPVHQFESLMGEYARTRLTGAQTQTAVAALTGKALTPSELTEAQDLLATITGSAVAKLARVAEINHVLMLAETRAVVEYDSVVEVKTRLGVPL